jgi:hypothetical protein
MVLKMEEIAQIVGPNTITPAVGKKEKSSMMMDIMKLDLTPEKEMPYWTKWLMMTDLTGSSLRCEWLANDPRKSGVIDV